MNMKTSMTTRFEFQNAIIRAVLFFVSHFHLLKLQRLLMPMNVPTRCSSCKNSGVKTLKRCTNCFNVAYCDQACQRTHWSAHKPNCRPKPSIIAHPFIISMLKSELTYRNLYDTMLAYSK